MCSAFFLRIQSGGLDAEERIAIFSENCSFERAQGGKMARPRFASR
jgi:hypothetical protein